jgi:hypothetical protein
MNTTTKALPIFRHELEVGDYEDIGTFMDRCYGPEGNDLGEVTVGVAKATDEDGKEYWVVGSYDEAVTNDEGVYATREDAIERANEVIETQDETPDVADVIVEIEGTGYFSDPAIIPSVIKAATEYSQGYLLVTPDIHQPVGIAWTTNGYLQDCDYIALDATYGSEEEAAEALLSAIRDYQSDDEESN